MKQKGFTLIEILVVVAIVGTLSSIVITSLNSQRAKGRDSVRRQTLKQFQIALQLYYEDYGSYPVTGTGSWLSSEPGDLVTHSANYIPGLAPTYINTLPRDPKAGPASQITNPPCSGGWKSAYLYMSDGVKYKILSHCAPESFPPGDTIIDPYRPTWAWAVCEPIKPCSSANYPW